MVVLKMTKAQQDERLIQFFMGLNEAYGNIKSNILMILPLPFVSFAYSILIHDVKQREIFVYSNPARDHSSYLVTDSNTLPQ